MVMYVQTVTGRIATGDLGSTLMHEHILSDLRDPATRNDDQDWPTITFENRFQIVCLL